MKSLAPSHVRPASRHPSLTAIIARPVGQINYSDPKVPTSRRSDCSSIPPGQEVIPGPAYFFREGIEGGRVPAEAGAGEWRRGAAGADGVSALALSVFAHCLRAETPGRILLSRPAATLLETEVSMSTRAPVWHPGDETGV